MAEAVTTATIDNVPIVSIRVTCDRRGCPAVGGASTPVDTDTATAAAQCRAIVGQRWSLTAGLTLCGPCTHRPGYDQPALTEDSGSR